jgi:23S rRNA (pseudouridine1915-N3)-methyltransferase
MYKVKILTIGKIKDDWLEKAISEYVKRLKPILEIEFHLARNHSQLLQWIEKETHILCLDAQGKLMNSEKFSDFILAHLLEGGSRSTFVIGGAEGLPDSVKSKYPLISLSPMTFTHAMVRVILIEQIYRAFEIAKGSRYHK